ncbi:MAG: ABC-F family ATP-binding cassette domain-containing protein [Alistipes ihumii]
MISVDNLTVSFGGQDLFKEISFLINPKDRIGLVGKNGAGKSTMLKVLVGEQPPTSGGVSRNGECTIGYLPQQMKVADTTTLYAEVESVSRSARSGKGDRRLTAQIAERTDERVRETAAPAQRRDGRFISSAARTARRSRKRCSGSVSSEKTSRATREFSGGYACASSWPSCCLRRSVFLLDGQTNSISSIQWLEGYPGIHGAVVLISHDRAFLDNVTTRTIELSLGKAYDYKVPYSRYVELRRERREQQMAAYLNQQKMIEQTEEFIERFRYKPTKSNQVQSRIKQLEKIERIEIDEEDTSALNIKFPPAPRSGQIVVEAKNAGMSFGAKHVFSGATFTIERGQKVALVGRNGEGKTTFARMAIGELTPTEGSVRIGHNVRIGYYAQNQDDLMNGDFTVFDTLDRVAVGNIRTRLRDILGAFLFRGEEIDKKVRVLSGGERARLAMARLMLEPYNLLVLDEPTNHMDMRSKDILKNAVKKYDGTVIVISHDREFLDGLVERVYEFRDGTVKEHLGGIYDFLRDRQIASMREIERKKAPAADTGAKAPKVSGKAEYERKREAEKQLRKAERDVERTETEIMDLEKQIAELDRQMADPAAHGIDLSDGTVYARYNEMKERLTKQTYRWEELSITLENLKDSLKA